MFLTSKKLKNDLTKYKIGKSRRFASEFHFTIKQQFNLQQIDRKTNRYEIHSLINKFN